MYWRWCFRSRPSMSLTLKRRHYASHCFNVVGDQLLCVQRETRFHLVEYFFIEWTVNSCVVGHKSPFIDWKRFAFCDYAKWWIWLCHKLLYLMNRTFYKHKNITNLKKHARKFAKHKFCDISYKMRFCNIGQWWYPAGIYGETTEKSETFHC